MPDDKTRTGGQDRRRINVHEDYELRDWSEKFGVTPEELAAQRANSRARRRGRQPESVKATGEGTRVA